MDTWYRQVARAGSLSLEYLILARSFCRYHFDGTARPFFEGWYFKVAIPECRQSFCFMYSVENPLFRDGMSDLDKLVHGPRFTGVGAQILGADDKYICQFSEKSNNFWGSKLLLQSLCSFLLFYLTLLFWEDIEIDWHVSWICSMYNKVLNWRFLQICNEVRQIQLMVLLQPYFNETWTVSWHLEMKFQCSIVQFSHTPD